MNQDELTKQIAADLGISELAPAEQEQVIAAFGEVALKAATAAVIEKLTAEKRALFVDLAEKGDPAALQAFLDAEVPDHESIAKQAVEDEVKRFREANA